MKTYVSFGQYQAHKVDGKILDKDCLAEIEAKDFREARVKVFDYFWPHYSGTFTEDHVKKTGLLKCFPRGVISV